MLKPELLPGVSGMKGYRGSCLLRRAAGEEVEFITIMFWECIGTALLIVVLAVVPAVARGRVIFVRGGAHCYPLTGRGPEGWP